MKTAKTLLDILIPTHLFVEGCGLGQGELREVACHV
jgi:hypothetical protein